MTLKSLIPKPYHFELLTIGDHIKRKRLESGLLLREAAKIMGVRMETVIHWESGQTLEPNLKAWPHIIRFLNYCPYKPCPLLHQKSAMWRKSNGYSLKHIAKLLSVDERTYKKFEDGCRLSRRTGEMLNKRVMCLLKGKQELMNFQNWQ